MARCFVIQPFDSAEFDRRFDEIYEPAIRLAGFEPYRVDRDVGSSIPIQTIENEIRSSSACFVDISVDNPNVWFEFGFAISSNKPACIICSNVRTKLPFDIQHRRVIFYKTQSPSDFQALQSAITERLKAAENEIRIEPSPIHIQGNNDGEVLSEVEFQALCVCFEYSGDKNELDFADIQNGMDRIGFNRLAARVGLESLMRKEYVVINEIGGSEKLYYVSRKGKNYVLSHINQISLRHESIPF